MPHETTLITTIVAGLVLAFIFGTIANRFRLPPLVGYLFAGILVGPYTPGFTADGALAGQLSEIGVILLMFGVGLHFSLKDLMSVRALAIPGAIVQIGFATALGVGLALLLGWGLGGGLVFGLALSVASTVVLLKALQDRRLIDTDRGKLAVGWLIVEDLAMVLALVLIPAFATLGGEGVVTVHDPFVSFVERLAGTDIGIFGVIGITLVKLLAFVGFMLVVGRRVIPWMLHAVAHTGNRELFRLAVLAIALGVALGSAYLFGVSLALGAFFAGMILSESELSQRAAQETLPLRDAFAVLFFVSVGMLFDPTILLREPLPVLATVLIIVAGKALIAYGIVRLFRHPVSTAVVIAASLAQIGEFSFILADLGVGLNIMPEAGRSYILAGAIISIVLNPLMFFVMERMRPRIEAKAPQRKMVKPEPADGVRTEPSLDPQAPIAATAETVVETEGEESNEVEPTRLTGHTIVVGYGRVGLVAADGLLARGEPFVLIEDADARVALARAKGIEVVVGNAASPEVLRLANVTGAQALLVAIPNAFEAGQVTEQGRKLNKSMRIIVRSHSLDEEDYLNKLGADVVIMGEREIGLGMLAHLASMEGTRDALPGELLRAMPGGPALEPEPAAKLPANPNLLQDMAEAEQLSVPETVDPAEAVVPPREDIVTEFAAAPAEAQIAPEPAIFHVEPEPPEPDLVVETAVELPKAELIVIAPAEPVAIDEPPVVASPTESPELPVAAVETAASEPDLVAELEAELPKDDGIIVPPVVAEPVLPAEALHAEPPLAASGEPMRFEPLLAVAAPAEPQPAEPLPETPPAEPQPDSPPLPPEPQPPLPVEPEEPREPIQVPPEPAPEAPPAPGEIPLPPAEVPAGEPPMIAPTPLEAPVFDPVELPDAYPPIEVPMPDPGPSPMQPTRMEGVESIMSEDDEIDPSAADPAGEALDPERQGSN